MCGAGRGRRSRAPAATTGGTPATAGREQGNRDKQGRGNLSVQLHIGHLSNTKECTH